MRSTSGLSIIQINKDLHARLKLCALLGHKTLMATAEEILEEGLRKKFSQMPGVGEQAAQESEKVLEAHPEKVILGPGKEQSWEDNQAIAEEDAKNRREAYMRDPIAYVAGTHSGESKG